MYAEMYASTFKGMNAFTLKKTTRYYGRKEEKFSLSIILRVTSSQPSTMMLIEMPFDISIAPSHISTDSSIGPVSGGLKRAERTSSSGYFGV